MQWGLIEAAVVRSKARVRLVVGYANALLGIGWSVAWGAGLRAGHCAGGVLHALLGEERTVRCPS